MKFIVRGIDFETDDGDTEEYTYMIGAFKAIIVALVIEIRWVLVCQNVAIKLFAFLMTIGGGGR